MWYFMHEDLNIFPESRGIIIADCFGITKCFENWIASKDFIFDGELI